MNSLHEFDKEMSSEYAVSSVCGIDEAGRGCLAGDVFAAAVILNRRAIIEGLNDSKKLTPQKREKLYDIIVEEALAYSIGRASVEEIEELNILNASMLAMKRAYDTLRAENAWLYQQKHGHICLIDGNKSPDLDARSVTVIKGDGKSASIAAASVLAKVTRDRYMLELDELHPEYNFKKHKSYGTKEHYEAIEKHGLSPVHRKSFLRKFFGEK